MLIFALAACLTPSPTFQQGLDYGFRTPKQTVAAWRTALQADLLVEEYRCFSEAWKAQNGVRSLTAYGAVRDAIFEEVPRLRWAIARAEDPLEVGPEVQGQSLLQMRVPGALWLADWYLIVQLQKEPSWDLWYEGDPRSPEYGAVVAPGPMAGGLFEYDAEEDALRVEIDDFDELTQGLSPGAVTEIRAGWQWKITEFAVTQEPLAD